MKKLHELTKMEYEALKSADVLQSIYPGATGDFSQDVLEGKNEEINKVEESDLIK